MINFGPGKRLWFIAVDLILLFLMIASFYFCTNELVIYFSCAEQFVYSYFTIFGALFFLVLLPVFLLSLSPVFYGRQSSTAFQLKMASFIKSSFFLILFFTLIFNVFYLYKIDDMGYVKCRGVPSGWMPGMATKYALNESLCHQN